LGSPTGMSTRCLASGPVMLPSPRRLPRSLRTEPPALARQPWQTCTGRTGSWSCKRVAPSADPLPADLPHRGPRTRVTVRSGSGCALPHFPRSKARPDSDHVAVVLALGRAPSSAVDDEAGALFQLSPSPWRHALRRFLLASSSTASPRPLPSRLQTSASIPPPVLPRVMGWAQPAGHKALLHCRVRCRPRCCHRERPVPSLGLRTFKTFRRFRECETSFWCSPDVASGWGGRLRRSAACPPRPSRRAWP
jgi:hypothetical protein